MSFAWIFAALLGGAILFIAVFFVTRFSDTKKYEINLETSKEIANALSPYETGIASGSGGKIDFSQDVRVYNKCYLEGAGRQAISTSIKSFNQWSQKGGEISVKDKYVFSEDINEGRVVYLISREFKFPFKAGNLILMYTKKYCFKDAPEEFKDDINRISVGNIKFDNCAKSDVKVCFEEGCDISVYGIGGRYDKGYVERDGKRVYYADDLIYGAIFSEPDIYECNVKRIMKRISELAGVYSEEAAAYAFGCGLSLQNSLDLFSNLASRVSSSEELISPLKPEADKLNSENSVLMEDCKLWD